MSKEVQQMFASIAHRYDCANDVLSLGIHRLWRERATKAHIRADAMVLDLCCGTGDFAASAARRSGRRGVVIAIDFVYEMLHLAAKKAAADARAPGSSAAPIHYLQGDAMRLPLPDACVDAVTIGFGIRNVDNPLHCLREIHRVLRQDGKVIVLEFGWPQAPGFSQLYGFYCRHLMPLIGRMLTGNAAAYRYLPETARAFPAGPSFVALLEEAGYTSAAATPLLSGLAYIYSATASR